MPGDRLHILQVNTRDVGGGAERVAFDLFRTYRVRGHDSHLVVGFKRSGDPDVRTMGHGLATNRWAAWWWRWHERMQPWYGRSGAVRRLCRWAQALAAPRGVVDRFRGVEDFHYPGARRLLANGQPDLVHLHNLHGGYFDLRVLPELCRRVPVFLTLHDAWLLSGHCAHSLACDRWRGGCGDCPDLSLYPAVRRDATAFNWERKRAIFSQCQLRVATPCRWLMDRVADSLLAPAIVERRVIRYGVDLTVFRPGHRAAARSALGLDPDAIILLFAAAGIRRNPWKDYEMLRAAVARLAALRTDRKIIFLALGENGESESIGGARVQFVPFELNPRRVAHYCQAADVYLHASRADTFPNAVLEALACGTPVVATAVGGIAEQIRSPGDYLGGASAVTGACADEPPTGFVVPGGDAGAMAHAVDRLIGDDKLHRRMAGNAAADGRARFDLGRQADEYLRWYTEVRGRNGGRALGAGVRSAAPPEPVAV